MNPFLNKYVIHVDDDDDDRFLLQKVFEQYSREFTLTSLANSTELISILDQATTLPALILLDLNMPGMDGFEVLRSIRQLSRYKAIPVVILTTSYQPKDHHMATELEANGFITKPSTLRQLNQLVLDLNLTWLSDRQKVPTPSA